MGVAKFGSDSSGGSGLHGAIDDFAVFDYAWSAEQIRRSSGRTCNLE